jgi:5S rRNA maturation endonuclease (ribonuclease M5)
MKITSLSDEELKRMEKQLKRAFEELNEKGAVIVVEGKKDREALQRAGVNNKIVLINRSPDELSSRISDEKKAIILTDFDNAGEEMRSRMEEISQNIGSDKLREHG